MSHFARNQGRDRAMKMVARCPVENAFSAILALSETQQEMLCTRYADFFDKSPSLRGRTLSFSHHKEPAA
jgi:hypothetical protein